MESRTVAPRFRPVTCGPQAAVTQPGRRPRLIPPAVLYEHWVLLHSYVSVSFRTLLIAGDRKKNLNTHTHTHSGDVKLNMNSKARVFASGMAGFGCSDHFISIEPLSSLSGGFPPLSLCAHCPPHRARLTPSQIQVQEKRLASL